MPWVTKSSTESYTPAPPPREYTRGEKAQNWWHYHKWMVAAGAAALIAVALIAREALTQVRPDVRVGCVVRQELPPGTVTALQTALQAWVTDQNGDGRTVVQLDQYILELETPADPEADPLDSAARTAGITRLTADLSLPDGPYVLLLEEPEAFQRQLGALAYLDGSVPDPDDETFAAGDWAQMVLPWAACPAAAGLDLGNYESMTPEGEHYTAPSQDVLAGLYLGRRAAFTEAQAEAAGPGEALWQALTAGAPREEGSR